MLKNTLCHLPGVGLRRETELWNAGIRSWDDVTEESLGSMREDKRMKLIKYVQMSRDELASCNAGYFGKALTMNQHWRIYREFRHSTAFLDIETTGMAPPNHYITSIAVYDGEKVRTFVHGKNLSDFPRFIENYSLIVTYNGKSFDLPFITKMMGIRFLQAHIDLRHVLFRLGMKGGLKGCEKLIGIDRGELDGVDGYFAVLLWRNYLAGNKKALTTLLSYNVEDVLNLETLMIYAYNANIGRLGLQDIPAIEPKKPVKNPYQPDMETINRIKKYIGFRSG